MNTLKRDKEGNPPPEILPEFIATSRANSIELNEDLG
jgi:hypothetical protein